MTLRPRFATLEGANQTQGANTMPWKLVMIDVGDEDANLKGLRLQDAFAAIFLNVGAPRGAVMLGGLDIHDKKYRYYFSPAAVRIADPLLASYSAQDCPAPPQKLLPFLVGNAGDRVTG